MDQQPGPLDRLLAAAFEVFGISADDAWRDEARYFVGVIADSAGMIAAADLGDHAEPATVYRA